MNILTFSGIESLLFPLPRTLLWIATLVLLCEAPQMF